MSLLIDSALRATVILAAAWFASLLLRRASADVRHRVWLAAILAIASLPVVLSLPHVALPARFVISSAAMGAASGSTARMVRSFPQLFSVLPVIWFAGALAVLAKLVLGLIRVSRITSRARVIGGISYSNEVAAPITWGLLRPAIILPEYMADWSANERSLVIDHERAHIERRDWLWQVASRAVTAMFWFHPLVWLAAAELRREAEAAVDDRVLRSGADASDYAVRLVDVAKRVQRPAMLAAVAMVSRPELEIRVRAILDPKRSRARAHVMTRAAIALCAAVLILPLAGMQAEKVYRIGGGVSAPKVLSKVEPKYTEEARAAKIEGTVVLQMEIGTDGRADHIVVKRSLDEGLDANAIQAISQWQFKPGEKDGKPVRVFATIEMNFHLL